MVKRAREGMLLLTLMKLSDHLVMKRSASHDRGVAARWRGEMIAKALEREWSGCSRGRQIDGDEPQSGKEEVRKKGTVIN